MELFHYHHWTNKLEETENFYAQSGFQVAGRFAVVHNGIQTYDPPLTWDDFRDENPRFRIIEMRKGKVNVTFGIGKRHKFDHIGYLVTKEEHDELCSRARNLGWNVNEGERRTFIGTPARLRIELQQRGDVILEDTDSYQLKSMQITVKDLSTVQDFPKLLGNHSTKLHFSVGEELALKKVVIRGEKNIITTDPNGVTVEVLQ